MSSIAYSPVHIQTSPQSVPALPAWFGEVTIIAHSLGHLGLLQRLSAQVRFARRRFGRYEVIDFIAVLVGYALSSVPTLEQFYQQVLPFATPFMALFGRDRLPHRSTLSRFLTALDAPTVEALRTLMQQDLLARSLTTTDGQLVGLWDRQGERWVVFDVDGTRHAARQRALPQTPELPAAQRRLDPVCAPGYRGRQRGEVVRTRTTVLQAHTHQWLGTFGGAGNGDYRGDLLRAGTVITAYLTAQQMPVAQGIVRLDGLYGDGAIVADLIRLGLNFLLRGRDYALLDLPQVQARLALPADQQTTHPETGTTRALYDCPEVLLTATGPTARVIIATHPATTTPSPIGVTRQEVVYELFFTALPPGAFAPADVMALYLHRGAFETVLADEDREQDPDRWCSYTACGQETWQILSHWMWNLRLELGHHLSPTPVRTTEFAPAHAAAESVPGSAPALPVTYGPPQWARRSYTHGFAGADFVPQLDGTLRCPAGHPLYPQERRPEREGSVRLLYTARLRDCRPCPLRSQCQEHPHTAKPRQVSAVFWPVSEPSATAASPATRAPATAAVLWKDGSRCQTRRQWMRLLRSQRVDLRSVSPSVTPAPLVPALLTRAQRAHWRLAWQERLTRNAPSPSLPAFSLTLFGIPDAFARRIGLATA